MNVKLIYVGNNFSLFINQFNNSLSQNIFRRCIHLQNNLAQESQKNKVNIEEEQFRVINLIKKRLPRRAKRFSYDVFFKQPREKYQSVKQDWGNVWPGIRSFHPATVPLPVRMGYPSKGNPVPDKWGNAELMKIPNFLHLTPPVIKRQCEAIKKFCTEWPAGLESREDQDRYFPVSVITETYLHSSPSIRDQRSRVVTYKVKLDSLNLDFHAKDKLLRLVGDRHDPESNTLTLVADRCPRRVQNRQYCEYLLTVLFKESKKVEPWENSKEEDDHEKFSFDRSSSKESLDRLIKERSLPPRGSHAESYQKVLEKIHNEGEDEESLKQYGNAVKNILNLTL